MERRTPVGGVLSAPLVSMLLALAGAAAGLLPTASAAADAIWVRACAHTPSFAPAAALPRSIHAQRSRPHSSPPATLPHTPTPPHPNTSNTTHTHTAHCACVTPRPRLSHAGATPQAYLMPLGAACYLLESDLSQLLGSAGPTLAAFVVGAVGTLAGTLVAFWLVGPRLGPDGWKVASALCASYIGGEHGIQGPRRSRAGGANCPAAELAAQAATSRMPGLGEAGAAVLLWKHFQQQHT